MAPFPTAMLWAHQLKREHGHLLQRLRQLESHARLQDARIDETLQKQRVPTEKIDPRAAEGSSVEREKREKELDAKISMLTERVRGEEVDRKKLEEKIRVVEDENLRLKRENGLLWGRVEVIWRMVGKGDDESGKNKGEGRTGEGSRGTAKPAANAEPAAPAAPAPAAPTPPAIVPPKRSEQKPRAAAPPKAAEAVIPQKRRHISPKMSEVEKRLMRMPDAKANKLPDTQANRKTEKGLQLLPAEKGPPNSKSLPMADRAKGDKSVGKAATEKDKWRAKEPARKLETISGTKRPAPPAKAAAPRRRIVQVDDKIPL
ncbi:hypothetical protein K470DRAFT_259228 [Piedraia hortae CBS 480.64]|uniref:Uncharacterized protein n=1 Tax=Piedraia hortae CBS 480.64 TaxID=1314780 RepID=A0A6A7BVQ3_9PEZI|nr:hypothetical protein K470DRAFT_259228 [Piedraia hortae CBS 480.64]